MCVCVEWTPITPQLASPHVLSAVEISRGRRVCLDRRPQRRGGRPPPQPTHISSGTPTSDTFTRSDRRTDGRRPRMRDRKQATRFLLLHSVDRGSLACSFMILPAKETEIKSILRGSAAVYERRDCAVNMCGRFLAFVRDVA